jgi:hypothetical protein
MEEVEHKISVIEGAKQALLEKNGTRLRELSNETIHSASMNQDSASLITAVLIYSLSKLVERRDFARIKGWDKLADKLGVIFSSAVAAAVERDEVGYEERLKEARQTLEEFSVDFKHYIQEVVRKAEINKASKLYEHGISLGQTANLLGLTTWELAEYTGQGKSAEVKFNRTMDEKSRVKMALDFFEVSK